MHSLIHTPPASLNELSAQKSLPVVSQVALRFACAVYIWNTRARSRAALRALPRHHYADLNLTADQAREEYSKWFWRP